MRIVFDTDFDHGAWPGPRGPTSAVAGAVWVGSEGFLALLETLLGLAIPHASLAERASELVPRLFRADRFYGASAKVDPWATAHRLLTWRDELWGYGWRGEGLGEKRLGELAEVTLGLAPGPAERLEVVAGWLEGRVIDIDEVRLLAPPSTLALAWQRVLAPLKRAGTRVTIDPFPATNAKGNLQAVRGADAHIDREDRSIQVVRSHGPRQAARLVAAALAANPGFEHTLFVEPDGVLDDALAEFGLPTLGARTTHDASALAALLPLTLQLAWGPVDPQLALDWLTLPDVPLDSSLAARLAQTLEVWPAVGNPLWRGVVNALPQGDPARAVLQTLFDPLAERSAQIRVRDLLPRVELLQHWASRKTASPAHALVAAHARTLRGRFALAELHRLSPPKLDAVLASIVGDGTTIRQPTSVGYGSVGLPGGVAGPARRIIWWNFHESRSHRTRVMPRESERRALASIGVTLPSQGDAVRATAFRARRPLLQADETLIFVAPRHDSSGEPTQPHPLWDEIVGRLRQPEDQQHLQVDDPVFGTPSARTFIAMTPLTTPERTYSTSLPILPRAADSPSSLTKLLGCSFAYALDYTGRIRPSPSPRLVVESRLHGLLAHEVLAAAAREGVLPGRTHGEARRSVLSILEKYLHTHAALLMLHGHHHDLVLLREALGGTVELLSRVMQQDGLRLHAVEQEIRGDVRGRVLRGTPDIVLMDGQDRLILLDFKWSGEVSRREELRAGTSLQLAAYAMLLGRTGHFVRTMGYLILRSQRILVRGEPLAFSERVHAGGLSETWISAERAWDERSAELSRGELVAAGLPTEDVRPLATAAIENGRLGLPAPCTYCKLDLLCGREKNNA